MKRFIYFLQYHNAVPLAVGILVLGGGVTFAATNPDTIYSQTQHVVSIDNTYIVNRDLSTYSPQVQITGVTEDSDTYYIAYQLSTIDLDTDSVWKDVLKDKTLIVSKAVLGQYRDLGVYATEQLRQVTEHELAYLTEVQGIERNHESQKVVATAYGGLIGKFLNTSTETLPGYVPVVSGPPPEAQTAAAAAGSPQAGNTNSSSSSGSNTASGNPSLRVQVLGNNPSQIAQRSSYVDLGAAATDDRNSNLRIETYLDGKKVPEITIDTTATSTHTVRYVALDPQNNSVWAERTIIVYDPAIGPPVPDSQVQNSSSATPSATAPAPTPAPTPTPTPTPAPEPQPTPSTDTSSTTSSTADTGVTPQATSTDATTTPPDTSASSTPVVDTATTTATSTTP